MLESDFYSHHKLLKHLDRVVQWDRTGFVYPILVNFNLSNACNNRCPQCSTRYEDNSIVPVDRAYSLIDEFAALGVKAVGLGGGGDPTCHPDLCGIIEHIADCKLESGVVTNGYHLTDRVLDAIIGNSTWLRISLDADGPDLYRLTHGMEPGDFHRVIENIERCIEKRSILGRDIAIGLTYLIGRETIGGIANAARLAKGLGVDYIRFRPFFNWDSSVLSAEESQELAGALETAKAVADSTFHVSWAEDRCNSIQGKGKRKYGICHVHHFVAFINARLQLYPCCLLDGNSEYEFGSLVNSSFEEIWTSDARKDVCSRICLNDCPSPCMLENHNNFLWAVRQPIPHSNFL